MHVTQLKFYMEDVKCLSSETCAEFGLIYQLCVSVCYKCVCVCVCKFSLRALNISDPVNDICTLNICIILFYYYSNIFSILNKLIYKCRISQTIILVVFLLI
jgi:hypothetical protein